MLELLKAGGGTMGLDNSTVCQPAKFLVRARVYKEICVIAHRKTDIFHFGFEGQSIKVSSTLTKPIQ